MSETIQPPVNAVVTQGFGNVPDWDPDYYQQWGFPAHNGVDYGCGASAPVCGSLTAKLNKVAFEDGGFGQYARQDCGSFWLYYCHLTKGSVFARVGETIQQGRAFCYSGWTGAVYPEGSAGAHLHFGKRLKSYPANDPWKGWRDPFSEEVDMKPVIPTITPEFRVRVIVDSLNVRAGAGTGYARIGGLSKNWEAQVYETKELSGQIWVRFESASWLALWYANQQYAEFFSVPVTPPPDDLIARLEKLIADAKISGSPYVFVDIGDLQDVLDLAKG